MPSCFSCGADIVWREIAPDVKRAFDVHEAQAGPGRYVDTAEGLKPVTETASVPAYQLHAQTCSANR